MAPVHTSQKQSQEEFRVSLPRRTQNPGRGEASDTPRFHSNLRPEVWGEEKEKGFCRVSVPTEEDLNLVFTHVSLPALNKSPMRRRPYYPYSTDETQRHADDRGLVRAHVAAECQCWDFNSVWLQS